ncbi:hypothetical protein [Streptomyces virginiae]|uniref:hypothetical protein n=1 Tax=Streptomyces virginiae TaxID=1961 RepID=UPI0012FE99E5|nr:hypothetical protein [Streptomyces virginiae]
MSIAAYGTYARQLETLVTDVASGHWRRVADDVAHALNGQASAELRRTVSRADRRAAGSFFTTGEVRQSYEELLDRSAVSGRTLVIWDPTCGAGDLLIAGTGQFPLGATPAETLTLWNRRVRGHDLYDPFVTVARMRLVLAVLDRHRAVGSDAPLKEHRWRTAFPLLQVGDGLQALREASEGRGFGGRLLLNPPYGMDTALPGCTWSTGRTSLAATFTAHASAALAPGGRLFAVLPDVLRSGSRYRAWRDQLAERLEMEEIRPHGLFDDHTDVDVFLLSAIRRSRGHAGAVAWWPPAAVTTDSTIGDHFRIGVGPVVDNRDPHDGPEVPYLTAKELPGQGEMGLPLRSRRFGGRLIDPPFVVMRRTSRPGQGARGGARGTGVLIQGAQPVAVDNHLIVAEPLASGVTRCRELLEVLDGPKVVHWLDERIRCRHLTVTVVRSLPWG